MANCRAGSAVAPKCQLYVHGASAQVEARPSSVTGWLVTGWVSRRTERHEIASTITVLLTVLPLMLLSLPVGAAATKLAAEVWDGSTGAKPFWHYLVYDYEAGFIPVFATVLAVAVLPVAMLAPLRRTRAPH